MYKRQVLEASPEEPDREMRLLELDNAFHRRAFELCGMEHHFDHMLIFRNIQKRKSK